MERSRDRAAEFGLKRDDVVGASPVVPIETSCHVATNRRRDLHHSAGESGKGTNTGSYMASSKHKLQPVSTYQGKGMSVQLPLFTVE